MVLGNPDTGATTNALGKANRAYTGSLQLESPDIIRFTFGTNGQPADLGVMGLRTGIYIDGTVDTDMAVFVTGSGTADIAAGFTLPPPAIEAVDKAPFSVAFTSQSQYTITDLATDTVVVNRSYAAGESISYGNLRLTFDSQPDSGDSFIVDGNQQGLGDNGNMLSIVAMQDQPLLVGDRSIGDGYIDIVSYAGNKATLAKISQEALQVVYDQAVESRDKVSGVSLDQEAADLIRFQQAYQASAQIIQMSAKIFDSILAIR
jgi:flagellar hook-associated protein FlgK